MSEIYRVDVEITAPIYDTEVTNRVVDAVANIFPNADLEEEFGEVRGEAHALDHFSDLLHQQEILDTARGEFFANREGDTFTFALKKQAAFEDYINFSVGKPDELGEIAVRVRVEEPSLKEYVDHIAPPTEDGRPVDA
ncbi:RNA-binding domain-containing protein [Natrinema sp. H-ect1]|uniref:RNA-binding domain-containing protein n=1 Tax=Natrinema sp. H-ect1 TaxID=3242700 RepID=UPI00359DF65A